jgi:hypothetical protein
MIGVLNFLDLVPTGATAPSPPPFQLVGVACQEQNSFNIAQYCIASMASSLIGISVAVTLQNPPNTIVQGTVAAVNSQTSTLTLQNGE